jgi:hypothetical protein
MRPAVTVSRRDFLATAAMAGGALALGAPASAEEKQPLGKAEHCVFVWLGGGMSQVDTFDAKRTRGDGRKWPVVTTT